MKRKAEWTLAFAGSLLFAAVLYRFAFASTQPAAQAVKAPPGFFTIENLLKREYSCAGPLDAEDSRPGYVVIQPEEGTRFLGFAAAHMCPHDGRGPSFTAAQSVVAMQTEFGVYLGSWVRERKPLDRGPTWYLCFAVWLESERGREFRTGWAPVEMHTLAATGIGIRPRGNEAVDVTVTTANGDPVPGAMVSIDDSRYSPGRFYQFAFTGADGSIRVSGLDADRKWRIAIPAGIGPDRTPVVESISVPRAEPVVLASPLEGTWTYRRHLVRPPMRGGSFQIDSLDSDNGTLLPLWSVSPWVGPGRGPWCPLFLMHGSGVKLPERVTIEFRGSKPVKLDPIRETRIVCQAETSPKEAGR